MLDQSPGLGLVVDWAWGISRLQDSRDYRIKGHLAPVLASSPLLSNSKAAQPVSPVRAPWRRSWESGPVSLQSVAGQKRWPAVRAGGARQPDERTPAQSSCAVRKPMVDVISAFQRAKASFHPTYHCGKLTQGKKNGRKLFITCELL